MKLLPYLSLIAAIFYILVGIYIFLENSKQRISRLWLFLCFSLGIISFFDVYLYQSETSIKGFLAVICNGGIYLVFPLILQLLFAEYFGKFKHRYSYAFLYLPAVIMVINWISISNSNFNLSIKINQISIIIAIVIWATYSFIYYLLLFLGFKNVKKVKIRKQIKTLFISGIVGTLALTVNIGFTIMSDFKIPILDNLTLLSWFLGVGIAKYKYKFLSKDDVINPELILDNVTDLIIVTDSNGRIVNINSRAQEVLDYEQEEVYGKDLDFLFNSELGRFIFPLIDKAEKHYFKKELNIMTKRGVEIPVSFIGSKIQDKLMDNLGILIICQDISTIKKLEREIADRINEEKALRYHGMHDALTGIYNRGYFENEIDKLTKLEYFPVCIILCDVDGLKLINDTMGHSKGDVLLTLAAKVLEQSVSDQDVVCRIGGDEFAVILTNTSEEDIAKKVENIIEFSRLYNADYKQLYLSLSIGYSIAWDTTKEISDIFREADNNMYREKLGHSLAVRNRIVQALIKNLDTRDFVNLGHVDRLKKHCGDLARLIGLNGRELNDIELLASFHDIGKVGISDDILFKEDSLTQEERNEIRRHSEIGYRIAQSSPEISHIASCILKHHEWWDGNGYPLGLKGEEIPIQSRIIAIADAFDAMTSERPYRKIISESAAKEEINRLAGTQFDPGLVGKFISIL
ncbi:MAG TPA: diguanylate cyclase [Clostridiaceae bacterium]